MKIDQEKLKALMQKSDAEIKQLKSIRTISVIPMTHTEAFGTHYPPMNSNPYITDDGFIVMDTSNQRDLSDVSSHLYYWRSKHALEIEFDLP